MGVMASQITSLTIVYSTVYSDQRKYQSSASPAFVQGIHRWPVNSPHKCPVTRKMFPFDVIMHEFSTWEEIPMKFETPSYFPNHCRPSVGALNTNFNGIWNKTHIILFNKMHLKVLCAQCHHNVQAHWSLMIQTFWPVLAHVIECYQMPPGHYVTARYTVKTLMKKNMQITRYKLIICLR